MKHRPNLTQSKGNELLWLLGQPHLADYLDLVATKVVGGRDIDPRMLTDEWRAANDIFYELEQCEAGIADEIDAVPIDAALTPLADAVRANAWFRDSFDNLPASFMRVELDKLVVSQTHVECGFADMLGTALGPGPDDATLFQFCLPLDRPTPPVRIQRLSGDRFLFSCASNDFRAHRPRLLRPHELGPIDSIGPVAAMVGIMIGFGSNFMSAIRSGSRILLQNGYHRAYTLRRLGFTHAYCVVEDVTRKDELKLTADDEVATDPEFYFASKRPPILRDFFDERLAKALPMLPSETQVEVEIKVRSSTATDC
ncbi:MAG TPA: hypothetical protein VMS43_01100 [Allosphingosinicella sp.]|nr:hypothetical protein [Allosphingosinicella sp.]